MFKNFQQIILKLLFFCWAHLYILSANVYTSFENKQHPNLNRNLQTNYFDASNWDLNYFIPCDASDPDYAQAQLPSDLKNANVSIYHPYTSFTSFDGCSTAFGSFFVYNFQFYFIVKDDQETCTFNNFSFQMNCTPYLVSYVNFNTIKIDPADNTYYEIGVSKAILLDSDFYIGYHEKLLINNIVFKGMTDKFWIDYIYTTISFYNMDVKDTTGLDYPAIQIQNSSYSPVGSTIYIESCIFDNNINTLNLNSAALAILNSGNIDISKTKFTNNHGQTFGAIKIITCSQIKVNDSEFQSNKSQEDIGFGPDIYIQNVISVEITFTKFNLSSFGKNGGSVFIYQTSSFVKISNSDFTGCSTYALGTVFLQQITGDIDILHCNFSDSIAYQGSAFYIMEYNNLNIQNTTATGNIGVAGFLFGQISGINTLDTIKFNNNDGTYVSGGGIFLSSCLDTYILNSEFQENTSLTTGAGIHIDTHLGTLSIQSTLIKNNAATTIGGGIYLAVSTGSITLQGVQINGNTAVQNGGGLYVYNAPELNLSEVEFNNNSGVYGGGFLASTLTDININDCSFIENTGSVSGGGFYAEIVTTVTINNINLQQNSAQQYYGGGFYLITATSLTINGGQSSNNQAEFQGGSMRIQDITNLSIINYSFQGEQSVITGGGVSLENINTVFLDTINFSNCISGYGGGIDIKTVVNTEVISLIFEENQSNQGGGSGIRIDNGGLTAASTVQNIDVKHLILNKNHAYSSGAFHITNVEFCNNCILEYFVFQENYIDQIGGGGLYLNNIINFTVQNMEFFKNKAPTYGGGAQTFSNSQVTYRNLTFEENQSGKDGGGAYFYQESDSKYLDFKFQHNIGEDGGGGCYFSAISSSEFKNIIANNNTINKFNGGGFIINMGSDLEIDNIVAYNNEGKQGGGVALVEIQNSSFKNSKLYNNIALQKGGGLHTYLCENLDLQNLEIYENQAILDGGGLSLVSSDLGLQLQDSNISNNIANNQGGGIYIDNLKYSDFQNITIQNNIASREGGAIKITFSNTLSFIDLQIQNNTSSLKYGGGLHVDFTEIINFQDSFVNENSAQSGGAFFLQNVNQIILDTLEILSNVVDDQAGALYFEECDDLQIINSNINQNFAINEGGALYGSKLTNFQLKTSNLIENTASSGGGLYLTQYSSNIEIINSKISNNKVVELGGGIYLEASLNLKIDQTEILQNFANQSGGGLYLVNLDTLKIENSEIIQNTVATESGGAIFAQFLVETIINQVKILSNEAYLMGGALFFESSTTLNIQDSEMGQNSIIIDEIQQDSLGGSLYAKILKQLDIQNIIVEDSSSYYKGGGLYLEDIDQVIVKNASFLNCQVQLPSNLGIYQKSEGYSISQGGAIYFQNKKKLSQQQQRRNLNSDSQSIVIQNSSFEKCQASSGGGLFINKVFDSNLDLDLNNLTFTQNLADLGSAMRILGNLPESFIDLVQNNPSSLNLIFNNNYDQLLAQDQQQNIFFNYYLNERLVNSKDTQYYLCYAGGFLNEGGQETCNKCPDNAICDGGYVPIYPKEGFWRPNNYTQTFYECTYQESCLGNDTCKEGYGGLLCEECDIINGQSKSGVKCSDCASESQIISTTTTTSIILAVLIFSQFNQNQQRIQQFLQKKILNMLGWIVMQDNQYYAIIKIFIMHNQIIALASKFDMKLPQSLIDFNGFVGNPANTISKQIDCLFEPDNLKEQYLARFYSFIVSLGICAIIFLVLHFTLLILRLFKKIRSSIYPSMIVSVSLCFFLSIQPGFISNSMHMMLCREIGDIQYSRFDSNVKCTDAFYIQVLVPLNLCILLVMAVIVPSIVLYQIIKYRKTLYTNYWRQRALGVFYQEVKRQNFYWEFICMYLKILIIIITSIYPDSDSVTIMSVLCVICIVFYTMLVMNLKPYNRDSLNRLSVISSITQALTVILGMCLINSGENAFFEIFAQITIVTCNILLHSYMLYLIAPEKIASLKIVAASLQIKKQPFIYLNTQLEKERKAKLKWMKIKRAIHLILLRKSWDNKSHSKNLYKEIKQFYKIILP